LQPENIFYVLESGAASGYYEAFTAIPAHATLEYYWDIFYGKG
jgi:hypothetical protein